jgi:hypothetical protein
MKRRHTFVTEMNTMTYEFDTFFTPVFERKIKKVMDKFPDWHDLPIMSKDECKGHTSNVQVPVYLQVLYNVKIGFANWDKIGIFFWLKNRKL